MNNIDRTNPDLEAAFEAAVEKLSDAADRLRLAAAGGGEMRPNPDLDAVFGITPPLPPSAEAMGTASSSVSGPTANQNTAPSVATNPDRSADASSTVGGPPKSEQPGPVPPEGAQVTEIGVLVRDAVRDAVRESVAASDGSVVDAATAATVVDAVPGSSPNVSSGSPGVQVTAANTNLGEAAFPRPSSADWPNTPDTRSANRTVMPEPQPSSQPVSQPESATRQAPGPQDTGIGTLARDAVREVVSDGLEFASSGTSSDSNATTGDTEPNRFSRGPDSNPLGTVPTNGPPGIQGFNANPGFNTNPVTNPTMPQADAVGGLQPNAGLQFTEIGVLARDAVRNAVSDSITGDTTASFSSRGPDSPPQGPDAPPNDTTADRSSRGSATNPMGTDTPWNDIGKLIAEALAQAVGDKLSDLAQAAKPPEKPAQAEASPLDVLATALGKLFPAANQTAQAAGNAVRGVGQTVDWFAKQVGWAGSDQPKGEPSGVKVDRASQNRGDDNSGVTESAAGEVARASQNETQSTTERLRDGVRNLAGKAFEGAGPPDDKADLTDGPMSVAKNFVKRKIGTRVAKFAGTRLGKTRMGQAAVRFTSNRLGSAGVGAARAAGGAARAAMTASSVAGAGSAASAAGAAGAGAAGSAGAGGAAVGAGGAAATVLGPIAAIAAAGVALKGMNDQVAEATDRLIQHNQQMGRFSIMLGSVMQEQANREMIRSAQQGDQLEASARFLMEQDQARKDNVAEIQVLATRLENTLMGAANSVVSKLLSPLNSIAGGINEQLNAGINFVDKEAQAEAQKKMDEFNQRDQEARDKLKKQ